MNQQLRAKKVRELLNKFAVKNNTYSVNELRIILAIERIIARLSSDVILEDHLIYN